MLEYGSFDFIIVGAGSTGTLLANRLSQNPSWKILLLEAGNNAKNNLTDIPALYAFTTFTDYNWGFVSTPQTGGCLGK